MKNLLAIFLFLISGLCLSQTKIHYPVKDSSFSQAKIEHQIVDSCFIFVPNVLHLSCDMNVKSYELRIFSDCEFLDFELIIYNRWGDVLYTTTDPKKFWCAEDQPNGVYIWKIKGTFLNGQKIDGHGPTTVIK